MRWAHASPKRRTALSRAYAADVADPIVAVDELDAGRAALSRGAWLEVRARFERAAGGRRRSGIREDGAVAR